MKEEITHEGVITKIDKNNIEVTVNAKGACGSCSMKNTCISTENTDKIIIIPRDGYENYNSGDHVIISSTTNQGYWAVILAYVLPIILIVALYFISFSYLNNELISAAISIGALAIYYIIIYFLNPLLKNKISFKIKHIDTH
jgi:sigma-E factor negative regulatory protein RseC